MFPPGLEPGTLSVLDSRDNHYSTETQIFGFSYTTYYNNNNYYYISIIDHIFGR